MLCKADDKPLISLKPSSLTNFLPFACGSKDFVQFWQNSLGHQVGRLVGRGIIDNCHKDLFTTIIWRIPAHWDLPAILKTCLQGFHVPKKAITNRVTDITPL